VEEGLITPQDAARHELRNIVIQVLGNKPEVEVNQKQHPLQTGDSFLLCSDGLHDVLTTSQMKEIMQSNASAGVARALVQAAITAETKDNITAVVVQTRANDVAAIASSGHGRRRQRPRWLVYLAVGLLLLLVAAFLLWLALGRGQFNLATAGLPTRSAATAEATAATPLPTSTTAVQSVVQSTSTLAPTISPSPTVTRTPSPTASPSATPPSRACVLTLAFVWSDAQIRANACTGDTNDAFERGREVIILQLTPVSAVGPARSDDPACADTLNEFIQVRALPPATVEGWILLNTVKTLQPGESCSP
jgi:hypothetical protein